MNQKFVLLLVFFNILVFRGQQNTLNDIASFKIKNSGAFIDKNKDVDGYYFYYEVDKLKKGQREFAIKMLDNNLNEIGTKSYIGRKNTVLADSKFNNQGLMFAFINRKDKNYKLVTLDRQGNLGDEIIIPVDKREIKYLSANMSSGNFNMLFPIDNKGFVFNYIRENKKIGYSLKYVATDGGKSWDFNSPAESKEILMINPIQANENVIVAIETSKKSLLSNTFKIKVLVLDIATGKLLFVKEFKKKENPKLLTNVFFTKDLDIVFLGEYFNEGDNIFKDKSLGLFAQIVDLEGNVKSDFRVSEKEHINKMLPSNAKEGKDRGYIYFHDVVKTQKETFYCIGEVYRKTASALGIAGALMGSRTPVTQLTITNAVFFEFDENFQLLDIEVFEKGKSRVPSLSDFGSPQLNAHALKNFGAFDYQFTQIDEENDRFYSAFIDYERIKNEKNKLAYKTIIYNNGKLSEDKFYLEKSNGKIKFRVLPGKLGHVMLLEYDRKEKTLDMHLEKLNVAP